METARITIISGSYSYVGATRKELMGEFEFFVDSRTGRYRVVESGRDSPTAAGNTLEEAARNLQAQIEKEA